MTITIDQAASFLNTASRQFAPEIAVKTRLGLEMESKLMQRTSTGEYYVTENMESSEILQPYQGQFTPKGTLTHSENAIRVRPIKIDLTFSEAQLEKWYYAWQNSYFEGGKDPRNYSYAQYVLEREITPKLQDDLNSVAWLGSYAAPTPGTAGDSVDSVDGFKKVIADAITAGKIPAANVYNSGTLSVSNMRDQVEGFLDSIPEALTSKGGKILCSPQLVRWYVRDYRGEYSSIPSLYNPEAGALRPVLVDAYNVELVPIATMAGSQRMVFLANGRDNMIWVDRAGYATYPNFIFDTAPRVLQCYATIYRGYGFEFPSEIYVNNQV
jgi:hypothetical protein